VCAPFDGPYSFQQVRHRHAEGLGEALKDGQAALPLAKAPGRRASPTPEQIAKKVTDRDPSPIAS
jgi:hypothetical protein